MSVSLNIARPEPSPEVARHVARLRKWLRRNPRKPDEPGPRARRITKSDTTRIVCTLGRLEKVARCKGNPYVDREDMVQEAIVANLEAARRRGADLSPDQIVRIGGRRMNRVVKRARRQFPGRLDCDCLVGTDGLTPLDRTAGGDVLVYGRGLLDMREALDCLMRRLPRRERIVLVLRYGLDGKPPLVREDIGHAMGLSDSRIHAIEVAAIQKLRELAQGSTARRDAA